MFRIRPLKQSNGVPAQVQPSAARPTVADSLFGPMSLPEVTEIDPEEGWALWNAAIQGKSGAEADTVLMGLLPA